jgi:RNA polymerase sigma factor (sigma-70 family)
MGNLPLAASRTQVLGARSCQRQAAGSSLTAPNKTPPSVAKTHSLHPERVFLHPKVLIQKKFLLACRTALCDKAQNVGETNHCLNSNSRSNGIVTEPNVPSSSSVSRTSLTLLQRARDNDQRAWDRIYALYAPLIAYWCREKHLQDADVADIQHDVFTAAFQKLGDFTHDSTPGKFRGWLKTITHNEIYDLWRRTPAGQTGMGGSDARDLLAHVPDSQTDDSSVPGVAAEKAILHRRAVELIATDFKESTWKAFWRTVIDDQRIKDVAEELSMTENAVSLAKARVLARLHEEFDGVLEH